MKAKKKEMNEIACGKQDGGLKPPLLGEEDLGGSDRKSPPFA
jgi:hypothetical protein